MVFHLNLLYPYKCLPHLETLSFLRYTFLTSSGAALKSFLLILIPHAFLKLPKLFKLSCLCQSISQSVFFSYHLNINIPLDLEACFDTSQLIGFVTSAFRVPILFITSFFAFTGFGSVECFSLSESWCLLFFILTTLSGFSSSPLTTTFSATFLSAEPGWLIRGAPPVFLSALALRLAISSFSSLSFRFQISCAASSRSLI